MNLKKYLLIALIAIYSQFSMADATQSIASILEGFNHFPSDADKSTLMEISDDEANSQHIQTIAMAIHNIAHHASDDDKSRMEMIAEDPDASDAERALAVIVAGINHRPSAEDRGILAALQ